MKRIFMAFCGGFLVSVMTAGSVWAQGAARTSATRDKNFEVVETTIAEIHRAIKSKELTATQLVSMYLARIKAYNGTCVSEPQGILGPITPIPHAGQINALMTLNLRPRARKEWGFDDRKA